MAVRTSAEAEGRRAVPGESWYSRSPDEVATALGVDPATGLTSAQAAELRQAGGPAPGNKSPFSLASAG
jgi:P-type Ca2+ transporter type 2C